MSFPEPSKQSIKQRQQTEEYLAIQKEVSSETHVNWYEIIMPSNWVFGC